MAKLTMRDVKIYGAGMLAGMGLFWGGIQYDMHETIEKNKTPEIELKVGEFGCEIEKITEWKPQKQNYECGEEITLFNKKDNSVAIRANYFNEKVTNIQVGYIGKNKIVNTKELDSIYMDTKKRINKINWIKNYAQNRENYKNMHKIQCDTLIMTEFGSKYNVSDLTGDGEYDRILYIGNHPGAVDYLRLSQDSSRFYETLDKLMNQN